MVVHSPKILESKEDATTITIIIIIIVIITIRCAVKASALM